MFVLYSARDLIDAQLLAEELERAGIEFVIKNRDLQGMIGELPATLRPEICVVHRGDIARAEVLKAEFERRSSSVVIGEDLRCRACSEQSPANFELCWRCGAPLA